MLSGLLKKREDSELPPLFCLFYHLGITPQQEVGWQPIQVGRHLGLQEKGLFSLRDCFRDASDFLFCLPSAKVFLFCLYLDTVMVTFLCPELTEISQNLLTALTPSGSIQE